MSKDLNSTQESADFCTMLATVIRQSTGDHNVTVRAIGPNISISVRASPEVVLSTVFVPLLLQHPRWEVKKHGWHHIYFNHHGLHTIQFNYNGRNKRPSKTYRGTRLKKAA